MQLLNALLNPQVIDNLINVRRHISADLLVSKFHCKATRSSSPPSHKRIKGGLDMQTRRKLNPQ